MNKADVNQRGGLRLDTNVVDFGFDAPKIAQVLGYLAHDLAIIKGCVETNNVVSDGFVFINGEILPFKQSAKGNTVVIVENKTTRVFKDGSTKYVLIDRHVEFGVSTQSYNWASFYRVKSLKSLEDLIAQKASLTTLNALVSRVEQLELFARPFSEGGSMLFWNKPADQIPEGWQEAINWRGRMPIGWDPDDSDFTPVGMSAGVKNPNLSIPANGWFAGSAIGGGKPTGQLVVTNGQNEQSESFESLSISSAQTISTYNLNPYRIVVFIEPII